MSPTLVSSSRWRARCQRQGLSHAWVVHGDGLDELTTTGPSTVLALADGSITEFTIDPADLGLRPATADDLRGGDPDENAEAITPRARR